MASWSASQGPPAEGKEGRFAALRARDFRLYYTGQVVSVAGQQMLWVTQGWLIYELTGSTLLLGAAALAQAVPATLLSLFGGVVADKVDQRRLLIYVQLAQMAILLALAVFSFAQTVTATHVIITAFALAAVGAFENPARQAMFAHLIPPPALTSAVALNSMVHPGTRVLGPVVGGYLLAYVMDVSTSAMTAAGAVFTLTAAGHGAYVLFLWAVRLPPIRRAAGNRFVRDMADGLRIIIRERVFGILIGSAYFTMFMALSMSVLFPVFAKDVLDVGPEGLGLMFMASGIGSLTGAFWASNIVVWMGRGRAIVLGLVVLGSMLVLFALSTWFPLSLLLLCLASAGGSVGSVAIQSGLHLMVPNEYRGRVMGYWGMTHTSIRPLGEMQLAGVAALFSAPFALALGGGLVIAFALLVVAPSRPVRALNAASDPQMITRHRVPSAPDNGATPESTPAPGESTPREGTGAPP